MRDESEIPHFQQRFADRRTVAQVAPGHDNVVGGMPIELLEQFNRESLLTFNAKRINGVQLVHGGASHKFLQQSKAAIEVGTELAGEGAVVECLR